MSGFMLAIVKETMIRVHFAFEELTLQCVTETTQLNVSTVIIESTKTRVP